MVAAKAMKITQIFLLSHDPHKLDCYTTLFLPLLIKSKIFFRSAESHPMKTCRIVYML